jgi:NTP pyrophosphatase (non-canonical NTP hydrolase)
MKSSPDREVEFNLASLPQIKDCFKSTDLISNKAAEQNSNGESIEKKAGWSDGGKEDKINFLNYNAYDTVSLSVEMCSKEQIEKKANEKKMERLNKECSESLKKCAGEFYEIADAMNKLDRHNMDTQDIFAQLCKQANLMKLDKLTIKNAITQKVAQLKDYRKISDGYDFNVDLVNIEKAANEFSLGEYSFLDKQVKTASNSDMPIIVTDGNRVIKNVSDLVKLAMDAKQNQLKAKSAYNDLSVIASKTK